MSVPRFPSCGVPKSGTAFQLLESTPEFCLVSSGSPTHLRLSTPVQCTLLGLLASSPALGPSFFACLVLAPLNNTPLSTLACRSCDRSTGNDRRLIPLTLCLLPGPTLFRRLLRRLLRRCGCELGEADSLDRFTQALGDGQGLLRPRLHLDVLDRGPILLANLVGGGGKHAVIETFHPLAADSEVFSLKRDCTFACFDSLDGIYRHVLADVVRQFIPTDFLGSTRPSSLHRTNNVPSTRYG